jgi:hypothetical protein
MEDGNLPLNFLARAGRQFGVVLVEAVAGGADGVEGEHGFVEIAVRELGEPVVARLRDTGQGHG